jgi:CheY-like chemotaxis protein
MEILVVEDSAGDAELLRECLAEHALQPSLSVAEDGDEALAFLLRQGRHAGSPRPDLILLDLNLPRTDGRKVLAAVKADGELRRIPVVVLTTSGAKEDVRACYDLHANCFITKPRHFDQYSRVVKAIEEFWFATVTLPPGD